MKAGFVEKAVLNNQKQSRKRKNKNAEKRKLKKVKIERQLEIVKKKEIIKTARSRLKN